MKRLRRWRNSERLSFSLSLSFSSLSLSPSTDRSSSRLQQINEQIETSQEELHEFDSEVQSENREFLLFTVTQ